MLKIDLAVNTLRSSDTSVHKCVTDVVVTDVVTDIIVHAEHVTLCAVSCFCNNYMQLFV